MLYVLKKEESTDFKIGGTLGFIEWDEKGSFVALHDNVGLDRSIILDRNPFGGYRWMTTAIKSIESIEEGMTETKIVVKTLNSTYSIYIYPFLGSEDVYDITIKFHAMENFLLPPRP